MIRLYHSALVPPSKSCLPQADAHLQVLIPCVGTDVPIHSAAPRKHLPQYHSRYRTHRWEENISDTSIWKFVTLCIKFLLLKSFLLFAHDKYRLKHLFLTFVVLRFISFLISLYHVTVTLGLFFCSLVCVHFLYSFFTFLLFIPISTFLLHPGEKIFMLFH